MLQRVCFLLQNGQTTPAQNLTLRARWSRLLGGQSSPPPRPPLTPRPIRRVTTTTTTPPTHTPTNTTTTITTTGTGHIPLGRSRGAGL